MTPSPSPRSAVRVLIVEDHVLFAQALELALFVEGYDVRRIPMPEEGTASTILNAAVRMRPRIVLLDLDLGKFGDGVRLVAPLAKMGTNVVVVTASADKGRWGEAMRYGARKVVSKNRPLNEVLATVRRLHQGLPVVTSEEREDLLRHWHEQRAQMQDLQARIDQLTRREREVLGALMKGRTVREIATTSVVSEATVRTQVKSILAKMEVSSQLAAVGVAHHLGWRPPQD